MKFAVLLLGCASQASAPEAVADAFVAPPDSFVVPADSFVAPAETASETVVEAATPCPSDMVAVDAFCIDRYEAPNIAGAQPLAFRTALEGGAWCGERKKRLCSEAEWLRACQGASKLPYPYGATYKRSTCNDDKTWRSPSWSTLGTYPSDASRAEAERLYQADPSGARAGCASEDSVMDLTGNVAEWVTRSFPNSTNHDHVMKGCYWAGCYGGAPPSCSFVNPAHPGGFRTYEGGFRCCAEKG